jgi:hypothetical protein
MVFLKKKGRFSLSLCLREKEREKREREREKSIKRETAHMSRPLPSLSLPPSLLSLLSLPDDLLVRLLTCSRRVTRVASGVCTSLRALSLQASTLLNVYSDEVTYAIPRLVPGVVVQTRENDDECWCVLSATDGPYGRVRYGLRRLDGVGTKTLTRADGLRLVSPTRTGELVFGLKSRALVSGVLVAVDGRHRCLMREDGQDEGLLHLSRQVVCKRVL